MFVAERVSKVSHAPAAKTLQRKIRLGRVAPKVTAKATPREPERVCQCPNKAAVLRRNVKGARYLRQAHFLRESAS